MKSEKEIREKLKWAKNFNGKSHAYMMGSIRTLEWVLEDSEGDSDG